LLYFYGTWLAGKAKKYSIDNLNNTIKKYSNNNK
jgi:hypothetical protein